MKKEHRNVIVKGIEFTWSVTMDGNYLSMKIWVNKKELKKVLLTGDTIITPDYVEDYIKKEIFRDG